MKRFIFFARACSCLYFFSSLTLSAQELNEFPNYVVIGAFAHHKNAVFFTEEANQSRFPAKFEMNPNRNLYYVYVLTTGDRELAIAEAVKLRADTKYFDTWVYSGPLGSFSLANSQNATGADFDPQTGGQLQAVVTEQGRKSDLQNVKNPTDRRATTPQTTSRDGRSASESDDLVHRNSAEKRIDAHGKPKQTLEGDTKNTAQGKLTPNDLSFSEGQSDANQAIAGNPENNNRGEAGAADAVVNSNVQPGSKQTLARDIKNAGEGKVTSTDGKVTNQADDARRPFSDATETRQQGNPPGADKSGQQRTANENSSSFDQGNPLASAESPVNIGDQGKADVEEGGKEIRTAAVQGPPPKRASEAPLQKEEVAGKDFYFYLFRADNLNMVNGEVDAIDFEKSRRMATYPGNKSVSVRMPSGKLKQISFVCQVFGYRKQQKEFQPEAPSEDLYLDDKGNVVVPFELVRLQKGDIAIMYNVFFFKDAAVMRPESRYEVNNLLDLLNENPTYKIRIHGHTNGNANGKIIRMNTPGNFYSLAGTKEGFGSAKKLSEERAIVIRDYLISSGVSPDRMEVRAWGGKKPIHDKHSVRANENVRVEIEILSDSKGI